MIAGTKVPILAASAVGLWSVGRIAYTRGYATGDPKKVRKSADIFGLVLKLVSQRSNPLYTVSAFSLLGECNSRRDYASLNVIP